MRGSRNRRVHERTKSIETLEGVVPIESLILVTMVERIPRHVQLLALLTGYQADSECLCARHDVARSAGIIERAQLRGVTNKTDKWPDDSRLASVNGSQLSVGTLAGGNVRQAQAVTCIALSCSKQSGARLVARATSLNPARPTLMSC